MAIGAGIGLLITIPIFVIPETHILLPLILSGLSGFVGQIFGTMGFHYLDAPRGSLITASRILFAGILRVSLFADPLTLKILLGGACIVFSLVGVSGVIEARNSRLSVSKRY